MPEATDNLPTPDFTYDPETDLVAGLRPFRKGSYRLEHEQIGNKFVVHNYGHGGAGITMAPGCAEEVRDIVQESGLASPGTPTAVLGAGVMGLTAATLLREMGLSVTIYAQHFCNTTSDRAGGQWSPSLVEPGTTAAAKTLFHRILRRAFRDYEDKIAGDCGVSRRPNYTWIKTKGFNKVPTDLIPAPERLERLPFEAHTNKGYKYETLLVEPPIYLKRLRDDLWAGDVEKVTMEFVSPAQVTDLDETIVINCTGLGSKKIWPDDDLFSKKGQLVMLPPQPALQYLYSSHGYIFPRQDKVVLGGTVENHVEDDTPDPERCEKMVDYVRKEFESSRRISSLNRAKERREIPEWFVRDK